MTRSIRLPRRLGEVHQPPGEAALEQLGPRRPVERERDDVHLEAAGLELVAQGVDEHLGAAVGERHLGGADDDPRLHARPRRDGSSPRGGAPGPRAGRRARRSSRARPLLRLHEVLDQPRRRLIEAVLLLEHGAHEPLEEQLGRRPCGRRRSAVPAPARWEKATGSCTYSRAFSASRPLRVSSPPPASVVDSARRWRTPERTF